MEWQDLTFRVPHRKNNKKGGEEIYREIMAVNFPELMKRHNYFYKIVPHGQHQYMSS